MGRWADAEALLNRLPAPDRTEGRFGFVAAHIAVARGQREVASAMLTAAVQRRRASYLPATVPALIASALGETASSRRWLDEARNELDPWLAFVHVDPAFDPVRQLPWFGRVVR